MQVYRPTIRGKLAKSYYGEFVDPGTGKRRRISLRCRDKSAAEILLHERIQRAAAAHAGMVNPYEGHLKHPLLEHVEDWRRWLLAKGNTPKYAKGRRAWARSVLEGCGFTLWNDIRPSDFQQWLGEQRTAGMGAVAANARLGAFKSFCRWMVRDRRAAESPVAYLTGFNARTDQRHPRRPLTEDELRALLAGTRKEPERFGMSGPERAQLYHVAAETGLRAGELRTLTWTCFDFDGDPPTVTVRAAYSKHRRDDTLPLRASTAQMLAASRDSRGVVDPETPRFPGRAREDFRYAASRLYGNPYGVDRTVGKRGRDQASP